MYQVPLVKIYIIDEKIYKMPPYNRADLAMKRGSSDYSCVISQLSNLYKGTLSAVA